MKLTKSISLLLLLCLLLPAGCSGPEEAPGTALELAGAVASQQELPAMDCLVWGQAELDAYLSAYYDLDPALFTDGAICCAGGTLADEIAVLILAREDSAQAVCDALSHYLALRAADFAAYFPTEARKASSGRVESRGRYVALLICPDPAQAAQTFQDCFSQGWTPPDPQDVLGVTPLPSPTQSAQSALSPLPPEVVSPFSSPSQSGEEAPSPAASPSPSAAPSAPAEPSPVPEEPSLPEEPAPEEPAPEEPEEDVYDHDRLLQAWECGDPSLLSPKNLAVYEAVQAVLSRCIREDMALWEKELAVHDAMLELGEYDPGIHSHLPGVLPDPDNDNPYGFLVRGVGICRGYASTFQLFMDVLGIPCITVEGQGLFEPHAWNQICLEEEWYCVDVTWDDTSGPSCEHLYFNVTASFMEASFHLWNPNAAPEATGTKYAYDALPLG